VIALAGSGMSFVNAVKSAREFGVSRGNQTIAGLLVWINDVHSLGLETAQGMLLTNAFYWDRDENKSVVASIFRPDETYAQHGRRR
jgi:branched-chain amino acid transport system substrate-binding protein